MKLVLVKAVKESQGESTYREMYFHVNFYAPIPCSWTSGKMLINIMGGEKHSKKRKSDYKPIFSKMFKIALQLYTAGSRAHSDTSLHLKRKRTYIQTRFCRYLLAVLQAFPGLVLQLMLPCFYIAADQPPKKQPWREAEIVTVCVAGDISETQLLFTVFLFPIKLQSPPIKHEEAFLWVWDSATRTQGGAALQLLHQNTLSPISSRAFGP